MTAITFAIERKRLRITTKEIDHEHYAVDRSRATRSPVSIRRRNEAGDADRGDAEADADTAAGLVLAGHRHLRNARRDRRDPSLAPAHTAGSNTTGRRRASDRYDRCDGVQFSGR